MITPPYSDVIRFHDLGGPEVLKIESCKTPLPSKHEVLIQVRAFALNRADILFIHGHHYTLPDLPSRIGSEAAGVVVAVGESVKYFKVGDKVCTIPHHNTKYGVQGCYALMDQSFVTMWPSILTAEQASASRSYLLKWYIAFLCYM